MVPTPQKVKISSPERVNRILQRVAQGGLSLQVRSVNQAEIAVKGRAISPETLATSKSFCIGGVSDKGKAHLAAFLDTGIQVEFVLMAVKVIFYSQILEITPNGILVSIPDYLTSIERRKDERFAMSMNSRAYINLGSWNPDIKDPTIQPFFEYQREQASLAPMGDISMGGISIVTRFPALCQVLQKGTIIETANVMFPLMGPIPAMLDIRWSKRLKETVNDLSGVPRTFKVYKFGVQFVNPSAKLQNEIQVMISKLSTAEAI